MSEPVNTPMYLRLTTSEPLSKSEVKEWYQIVKQLSPNGVMNSMQVESNNGRQSVLMVNKKLKSGQHVYEIPLSRDLIESEAEPIVFAWSAFYPEGQFRIESSATEIETTRKRLADAIQINQNDFDQLSESLAKKQHAYWLKNRLDSGWRYGIELNHVNKTHPLLQPWEQLSENHKSIDRDLPQTFLSLLEDYGYVVVKKSDLSKWLQKK